MYNFDMLSTKELADNMTAISFVLLDSVAHGELSSDFYAPIAEIMCCMAGTISARLKGGEDA